MIRSSLRALLRRPGYSLLAMGALALGVGGTTAVFSLVQNVLLRGLPYENPGRLVTPDVRSPQGYLISLSVPFYRAWSGKSRLFSDWGASAGWTFVRRGAGGSELLNARLVLGDFFGTLGMRAALGRVPSAEETERGAAPVAVLGYGFWQRVYGGDPGIIGRTLTTDQVTATIVGVLPRGAGYPSADVEAYLPMGALRDLPWDQEESSFGMRAVARLAPGATMHAAQADLSRVASDLAKDYGKPVAKPELRRLDDLFLSDVRTGLWVLLGAVGLLLLIACANVANLALARGEGRARELAVRAALGAGRRRLVLLLLSENAMLAALGGILGIGVAAVAVRLLPSLLPLDLPSLLLARVSLSPQVLLFALGTTLLSAILAGLLPALRLGRAGVGRLQHSARTGGAAGGRDARRLRDGLVVVQVALSLVLLVGAGLLGRSLGRLASVDIGFSAHDVLTARLQIPEGTLDSASARAGFYDALVDRLEASPDVTSAAATLLVPLLPRSWEQGIVPDNRPIARESVESVLYNVVTPDYFQTMGMPIRRGRSFTPEDGEHATKVAVIDQTMAEKFWPGENPVGKRVSFADHLQHGGAPEWITVVGVVANVRHYELQSPSRIEIYIPMRQARPLGLSVALRYRPGTGAAAAGLLRRTVSALQPGVALSDLRPLDAIVADALGPNRALGTLTLVFGTCAILLAAMGIFGVLSLAVAQRRQEIGVRMAVGATSGNVLGLIARYGLRLAVLGSVFGVLAALGATRLIRSLLFHAPAFDGLVYAGGTLLLLGVALGAALIPATRAARTDPARVLREE